MKGLFPKIGVLGTIVAFVTISFCFEVWAADKKAIEQQIKNQVDEVVAAIDSGKKAEDFEYLSKRRAPLSFHNEARRGGFVSSPLDKYLGIAL